VHSASVFVFYACEGEFVERFCLRMAFLCMKLLDCLSGYRCLFARVCCPLSPPLYH
jgi:hypothetical protein